MANRDKDEDLKVVDRFWPEIKSEELNSLMSAYPALGGFKKITFQSSRPLSAGCLIETDQGNYFVKRNSPDIRSKVDWEYEHRLVDSLNQRSTDPKDFDLNIPAICKNKNGETVHQLTDSGKIWLYEVQTMAKGEDLYKSSHTWSPLLEIDHAKGIGIGLANLHHAIRGSGFMDSRQPTYQKANFEVFYTHDLSAFLQDLVSNIHGFQTLSGSDKFIETTVSVYNSFILDSKQQNSIPRMVTHSDPQASNFFWEEGKPVSMIDFHLTNCNNYLYDLAVAVDRNCIYWLDLLSGKEDSHSIAHSQSILNSYKNRSIELGYSPVGWELFSKALVLHRLEFALSLCDYYLNVENSPFKAQWCLDVYIQGHGEWFCSNSGKRFLDEILV
ncbi:MAG: phosphotransferase [Leptospira sp.]|nr:phosphotransferase [Leptospira sp.]